MKQKLEYKEVEEFPIRTLSVVGDFNNWNKQANFFNKNEEGLWEIEVDFPVGQNLYKFVVNDEMTINDPTANLYMLNDLGELMSVMLIDEASGNRLYNNEQYNVEISSYSLNNYISKKMEVVNRSYFLDTDRKAVLGIGFKNITGTHSVTVAWYRPNGDLETFSENNLIQPEDGEAKLWFWLNLEKDLPKGQWQLKVFIDGIFIIEDVINIAEKRLKEENEPELLPIGTVVVLKDSSKRLMIYGRVQTEINSSKVWDYVGCLYPEGNIGPEHTFLFDREQVEIVEHVGFKDQEEENFIKTLKIKD